MSVAAGETLRVSLDSQADDGANEVYVRYGDVPSARVFDAAYSDAGLARPAGADPDHAGRRLLRPRPLAPVGRRQRRRRCAPTCCRSRSPTSRPTRAARRRQHAGSPSTSTARASSAGALVKLARPGVAEIEPERWQVIDATHIIAVVRPAQRAARPVRRRRHQPRRPARRRAVPLPGRARRSRPTSRSASAARAASSPATPRPTASRCRA